MKITVGFKPLQQHHSYLHVFSKYFLTHTLFLVNAICDPALTHIATARASDISSLLSVTSHVHDR
jgi:hypothetical protein